MWRLLTLLLIFVAGAAPTASWAETPTLPWQKWNPALLDRAAREQKYILLHMAAVWCHWCHVMEGTTYRDPAIQAAILDKFIHRRLGGPHRKRAPRAGGSSAPAPPVGSAAAVGGREAGSTVGTVLPPCTRTCSATDPS